MIDIAPVSACISNTRQIMKYENTPIVNLSVDSIRFDGEQRQTEKLNDFYERLTNAFLFFAKEAFYEYAVSDYLADENPRKKYRYCPFDLDFCLSQQAQDNNRVCIDVKITVSKRRKVIARKDVPHAWIIGKRNVYLTKRSPTHSER